MMDQKFKRSKSRFLSIHYISSNIFWYTLLSNMFYCFRRRRKRWWWQWRLAGWFCFPTTKPWQFRFKSVTKWLVVSVERLLSTFLIMCFFIIQIIRCRSQSALSWATCTVRGRDSLAPIYDLVADRHVAYTYTYTYTYRRFYLLPNNK